GGAGAGSAERPSRLSVAPHPRSPRPADDAPDAIQGPRERHTPEVLSAPMSNAPPWSLSPSACAAFKACPLAYRFSYLERLPEPPSPWTSNGTLVHRALELLLDRPAADRTIDSALTDLQ